MRGGMVTLAGKVRDWLRVLGGTPRVLRLVWDAHPGYAAALVALHTVRGLEPLGQALLMKHTVDALAAAVLLGRVPDVPAVLDLPVRLLAGGGAGVGLSLAAAYLLVLVGLRWLLHVLEQSLSPTSNLVQAQLADRLVREISVRIQRKANSFADISYFEDPKFHDSLQRAQNESRRRPVNVLEGLTSLFKAVLLLGSMLVVLLLWQPWLALLAAALGVPQLVVRLRLQRANFAVWRTSIPEVRQMRYFSGLLTGKEQAKEVRLFSLGEYFLRRYQEIFAAFHARYRGVRVRECWLETALSAVAAGGSWVAYVYVALAALGRRITLGDLSFYIGAFYQVQGSVANIVNDLATLYGDNLYVNEVFEFLDTPPAMRLPEAERALQPPRPLRLGVTFEHVGFQYPGTERRVLEDVSFSIAPGQCVALVGENGAGKTTLIKLLTRLYDPTDGRVLVDGRDLREYDLAAWRSQIGVIFQDFCRYHLPARDNIGLGDVARMNERGAVEAAAARGGAVAVVERLPDGYETILGRQFWTSQSNFGTERVQEGTDLSGGEWQKIALARAFMRAGASDASEGGEDGTAQLLILDEPTAALDVQAEYDVYLRFRELTRGKATLLISHRFSTVRMADQIVVLEDGRIVEQGSHGELMSRGGRYAELYEKQASRYR